MSGISFSTMGLTPSASPGGFPPIFSGVRTTTSIEALRKAAATIGSSLEVEIIEFECDDNENFKAKARVHGFLKTRDEYGRTPLMAAANVRAFKTMEFLAKLSSADELNLLDSEGHTALDQLNNINVFDSFDECIPLLACLKTMKNLGAKYGKDLKPKKDGKRPKPTFKTRDQMSPSQQLKADQAQKGFQGATWLPAPGEDLKPKADGKRSSASQSETAHSTSKAAASALSGVSSSTKSSSASAPSGGINGMPVFSHHASTMFEINNFERDENEQFKSKARLLEFRSTKDEYGMTPITTALTLFMFKTAKFLISVSTIDELNCLDKQGFTYLDRLTNFQSSQERMKPFITDEQYKESQDCIKLLESLGAKSSKDLKPKEDGKRSSPFLSEKSYNAFESAALNLILFKQTFAKLSTDADFDVNAQDPHGMTFLHHAAKAQNSASMKFLLKQKGILLNIIDFHRRTPLDYIQDAPIANYFYLFGLRIRDELPSDVIDKYIAEAIDFYHSVVRSTSGYSRREIAIQLKKQCNMTHWSFDKIEEYLKSKGWLEELDDLCEMPGETSENVSIDDDQFYCKLHKSTLLDQGDGKKA